MPSNWSEADLELRLRQGNVRVVGEPPRRPVVAHDSPVHAPHAPLGRTGASHDILLRLPLRLQSVANLREHWAAKARRAKRERQTVCQEFVRVGGIWMTHPTIPLVITITRIAPRPLDGDNLQAACKACRDGIADWLKTQDNDPLLTWHYAQQRGKPKEYAIEIRIKEGH